MELRATEYPTNAPNIKFPTISNENMAGTRKWVLSGSKATDVTFREIVQENRSWGQFALLFCKRFRRTYHNNVTTVPNASLPISSCKVKETSLETGR